MDSRIVLFLAIAVASCVCFPEPDPWPLQSKCACGRIFMPVCGSDGTNNQMYSNMCEFKCKAAFYEFIFNKQMHLVADDECGDLYAYDKGKH